MVSCCSCQLLLQGNLLFFVVGITKEEGALVTLLIRLEYVGSVGIFLIHDIYPVLLKSSIGFSLMLIRLIRVIVAGIRSALSLIILLF